MKIIFGFLLLLFAYYSTFSQQKFDVFISNSGNDSNAGKIFSNPLRSFEGSLPLIRKTVLEKGSVNIGLESGNYFNDALNPTSSLEVGTYNDRIFYKNNFAILNGSDDYNSGWKSAENMQNVFMQSVPTAGFKGEPVGGYNYIFVVEIDKELEKTVPLTARKILSYKSSIKDVEITPGSFYQLPTVSDSAQVFIHTSDGQSPNLHARFRYEVTARNRAVNSYVYDNNKFENLSVRGYGAGYGLLPGGYNSSYNKIIFGPGAAVHHLVLRNGVIDNSLFLPGVKNIGNIALTFYNAEGFNKMNKISNSIFLDIPYAIYSHTSYGSHYAKVDLNNVIAFADTSTSCLLVSTSDNDTLTLNNVYTDRYSRVVNVGHNYISPQVVLVNNSCFKDVMTGIVLGTNSIKAQINNTLIRSDQKPDITVLDMQANTMLSITNSIIHIQGSGSQNNFFSRTLGSKDQVTATRNIFIGAVNNPNDIVVGRFKSQKGNSSFKDKLDNNIYVLVSGGNMLWNINTNINAQESLVSSFNEWQRLSGQDANSLFFDLRQDSRGLKAIFIDAENGNYELANTLEGNKIKAIKAGMTQPVTCFLKRPSYEEAAEIIRSGNTLSMNSCKNPCLGTALFSATRLSTSALNNSQILLKWAVKNNQNVDRVEIERSTQGSSFSQIYSSVVNNDSVYTMIDDDVTPLVPYEYRLKITTKKGEQCYSSVNTIIRQFLTYTLNIYPNPTKGAIKMISAGYSGLGTVIVTTPAGHKILEKKVTLISGVPQNLELPKNSRGMYWLRLQLHDASIVKKLVVE
ncbi:MAG: T9SS type A sorting domain-containing protein [Ginsengibacter sp.]